MTARIRMKQWDAIIGALGVGATLATVNTLIATVIGLMTIALLWYRIRKEHKFRNRPPTKEETE